ncbi:MAG: SpoIIE family protein phosphatase, partial [Candidatus Riflebacteria bacterium]
GADDFIVKPWHNSEVRARLRTGERIIHLEDELKERIKKLEEANQIIRHANERMVREVTFMSRMHSTMLPPENMQFPGLRCVWKHQPHSMTAGDGMNFFRLDEKHFAVVMVDVSNSGDAASFLLGALARRLVPIPGQPGILKMLSRQAPGYEIMAPKKVVGILSQEFPLDLDSGKSFSIFYGVFDVTDSSLTYASAGFTQPLLLKRNGKIIETEPGEPAIGSKIGGKASQFKISLEPGDRFLAFSPGLSQLRDASGEPFGARRLIELLKRKYSAGLEDLTEEFFRAAMGWNPETTADASLILVEYSGDADHGA